MADADAKAPAKSNLGADLIASISPSSTSSGAGNAAAIESQFTDLAISDELPKPSGWDDDDVLGIAGSDETTGEITGGKVQPVETADSRPRFPQRHAEPDCTYYLKFGTCRFGMKCKFNHPARKKKNKVKASGSSGSGSNDISNKAFPPDDDQTPKEEYEDLVPDITADVDLLGRMEATQLKIADVTEKGIYLKKFNETEQKVAKENRKETVSEGTAQEECKYYSTPGGCKFGESCRYLHCEGKERKTEVAKVELNFLGLPLRPGGKECPYYMRTGSCKFATNCRFHHPDPTNVVSRDPLLEHENGDIPQQNVQASSQLNVPLWSADQRALNEHRVPSLAPAPSYSAGMIPPRGMYPSSEWSGYHQVPLGPYYTPGISFHHFPAPPVNHPMYRGADVQGHQELPSDEYPERPGEPECQHFVKSGFCKFKVKCKYHHPRSLVPPPTARALSPLGLPLRPDQPMCTYYERYGVCKFGPACMYNHPFNFGHPVSAAGPPLSAQYLTSGNYPV
ncbi:zinc finger CCCH domain-containing protein 65-like isoform X2 [Hordeum vulgare subsp. vulgare]|uniref:zinc finger CCCH domain-containing protein 65-like isoform X2 n=1 Tax=Hordeum vulgare subsp. vulgare TaxID=112509 RepID=UPI001D1A3EAF|nr:zinc finger CCCH domain-containing protein 65-like isoform X2 [Hordeum vulgare subsp. vulgare]